MSNLWKALLAGPFVLGTALSGSAVAADTAETVSVDALSNAESIQLAQVTSVSELSDVLPSDWAYTALQRLVEEYGCLEGYPDRSYRGNRAMTRYEFAAGLNACLDVIVQLIGPDGTSDLETIKRLQEEFAAELATIRGRVDTLEASVAELEANQFSTTTKLKGVLDTHLVVPFDAPNATEEVTFEYRASLNFDTSFTGEDRLRFRFRAGSDSANTALGDIGGLASAGNGGGAISDNVRFDDVYYAFPIGSRISATLAFNSMVADDFVTSTIVPFDGPAVGDLSGPIFYDSLGIGGGDAGLGLNIAFTDNLVLDLGYASANGSNAAVGLFDGYEYIAQLNFLSDGLIDAAITYMDGETVGGGSVDEIIAGLLNLDFGGFEVGGFFADQDGDVSWMAGVAVADFLGTGNSAGIYYTETFGDVDVAEAYYSVNVSDYLSVTPAVIYGDPAGNSGDSLYGAIRSTFKF
ncbi:MAG: iron uptake porin [Cyanobacteria bacterium P01_F01_bin.13]